LVSQTAELAQLLKQPLLQLFSLTKVGSQGNFFGQMGQLLNGSMLSPELQLGLDLQGADSQAV
jgi:hypothetical protein